MPRKLGRFHKALRHLHKLSGAFRRQQDRHRYSRASSPAAPTKATRCSCGTVSHHRERRERSRSQVGAEGRVILPAAKNSLVRRTEAQDVAAVAATACR
jgi:hypothetical protein